MNTYQPRTYRRRVNGADLASIRVVTRETDLHVQVALPDDSGNRSTLREYHKLARDAVAAARKHVSAEIALRREFADSRVPVSARENAPDVVRWMYRAGHIANVGPMAAVAGAIAQYVGRGLLQRTRQVIVENGGDIFLRTQWKRTVAIHAGESIFSDNVGLVVPAGETIGICTSSGTVGHSFSSGVADAAVTVSDDTAIADACATALGNRIHDAEDIGAALEWISEIGAIRGAVVICGEAMGAVGEFEIADISQ